MSTVPTQSINQFRPQPVPGDLDLAITKSGVITGRLASTVSGSLKAGQARVKLNAALAAGFTPEFVAAADNEDCIGIIKRTSKKSAFIAGDLVEVTYFGGPVMWVVAGDTIAPGDQLEFASGFAIPLDSGKIVGLALDPGVDSALLRIITLSGLVVPA